MLETQQYEALHKIFDKKTLKTPIANKQDYCYYQYDKLELNKRKIDYDRIQKC